MEWRFGGMDIGKVNIFLLLFFFKYAYNRLLTLMQFPKWQILPKFYRNFTEILGNGKGEYSLASFFRYAYNKLQFLMAGSL